jgi:NAD(P)-dependent dehydrogenase (short-subunit alcohol dehydrogenase family)
MVRGGRLLLVRDVDELRRARMRTVEVLFDGDVDPATYRVDGMGDVRVEGHVHHFTLSGDPGPLLTGLGPLSRVFTYSLSKAAVHNLSKNLAREWATQGVRVNTLVPGFFPAEQNRKVLTPDRVAKIMGHTPMNRFGEANELIGATLLLCSPAGSFITGHEMIVDGGFSSMTI